MGRIEGIGGPAPRPEGSGRGDGKKPTLNPDLKRLTTTAHKQFEKLGTPPLSKLPKTAPNPHERGLLSELPPYDKKV